MFDTHIESTKLLMQAERQYWAELTGRQVQELHEEHCQNCRFLSVFGTKHGDLKLQALQTKTDACLAAVEKLKKEIMERLRQAFLFGCSL